MRARPEDRFVLLHGVAGALLTLLMAIPWFIAVARVDANHHFVSDVAASIVVAAALTLAFVPLAKRRAAAIPAAP